LSRSMIYCFKFKLILHSQTTKLEETTSQKLRWIRR
jgi:hypothetical protein